MRGNPLLDGTASGPRPICPTRWHEMSFPEDGYQGVTSATLEAADVLRVAKRDQLSPRVVARLYGPRGDVVGLFTDRGERWMLTDAVRGALLADVPGVAFLKGQIPTEAPIALPRNTLLGQHGVKHYPFSDLSHVVVCESMGSDLLWAMVKASDIQSVIKYGGLPVLCCPDGDVSALEHVQWPDGVTILALRPPGGAASEHLADRIADVVFEVDTEIWEL